MTKKYSDSIFYHGSMIKNVRIDYDFEMYQKGVRWHAKATIRPQKYPQDDKNGNPFLESEKVVDIPLNGKGMSPAKKRLKARIIQDLNLNSIL
tara:strand:- start:6466 stop:6744 length:279 start_codon:yes stop_codon:yes gene_type:complete